MAKGTTRRSLAGGALLAVLGTTAAQAVPAAADGPDAELIATCAEHAKNRDLFNKGGLDSDNSPFWPPYARALDKIGGAEPLTLDGLVAKARAAKLEALLPSGGEDRDGTLVQRWAWDLVNDLVRIGGRA